MVECYGCDRDGIMINKGTPYKLCKRCNQYYYQHPRQRPTRHYDKVERNKANSERNKIRHLLKWGIEKRECYFCGTNSCPDSYNQETWCYNLSDSDELIGMLCHKCYEWIYRHGNPTITRRQAIETIEKKRKAVFAKPLRNHSGEKHWNWKGGISGYRNTIAISIAYKVWRRAVYKRDGYECQKCHSGESGTLIAHHIWPFHLYPEMRFDLDNGITLCRDCHNETFGHKDGIQFLAWMLVG